MSTLPQPSMRWPESYGPGSNGLGTPARRRVAASPGSKGEPPTKGGKLSPSREPRRVLGDISNTAVHGVGMAANSKMADTPKRLQLNPSTPTPACRSCAFDIFEDGTDEQRGVTVAEGNSFSHDGSSPAHVPKTTRERLFGGFDSIPLSSTCGRPQNLEAPLPEDLPDIDDFLEPPGSAEEASWHAVIEEPPDGLPRDPAEYARQIAVGACQHDLWAQREHALLTRSRVVALPGDEYDMSDSPGVQFPKVWPTLLTPEQDRSVSSPGRSPMSARAMPFGGMDFMDVDLDEPREGGSALCLGMSHGSPAAVLGPR